MSIAKDRSILALLAKLPMTSRGWVTVDHWEADLCAIGIASKEHPRRLVYVSTYGKECDRYYYECEEPSGVAPEEHKTVDRGTDVDFRTLARVIEGHLA
jgi:hypothetical protein